jgi:hypothetical protein
LAATSLLKKLRIPSGQRLLILNAPAGFLESLGDLPAGHEVSAEPGGAFPYVQLFVKDSDQLAELVPSAVAAVAYDGLFWLCYPKKSGQIHSDLSRDIVWKKMDGTGLRPVTQISIDETWSALRFRPAERVG